MERSLNLGRVDSKFFEDTTKKFVGRTAPFCFQCATCSSSCPVAKEMDIKPHQIVEMIKLGLKDSLIRCKALWQCSACYMCTERCPQGVKLTTIILSLRVIALRERIIIPESVKESWKNLYASGKLITVGKFQDARRKKLRLPDISPVKTKPIKRMLNKACISKILEVK